MKAQVFSLFALAACTPTEAVLTDPEWAVEATDLSTFETEDVTEEDGDEVDDVPATDDPVPLIWDGTREVAFALDFVCSEVLEEDGIEVTLDPAYTDLVQSCDFCDNVFELKVSPDSMCNGWIEVATTTYRGIVWHGDKAEIIQFSQDEWGNWRPERLAEGERDGAALTYHYEGWYDGWAWYQVDGKVVAHE